jgi:hypothetical protein
MAKAKKQQATTPIAQETKAPAKPAIPSAPAPPVAPVASKAAAQPATSPPAPTQPSATQTPAKQAAAAKPAESKSSKATTSKNSATAIAADAGKAAPKQAQKPARPPAPIIDTNLAAAAAANMVVHRDIATNTAPAAPTTGAAPAQPEAARPESASFKQLKQGLSKPAGSVGNLLGTPPGQKKSNLPFGGQKQSFRNQTFGADVNRTGVPRRTGG